MDSVRMVADWPVPNAAAVVLGANGAVLGSFGDLDREFPLASVTKLFTAYATLIAVEEGAVEWDQEAGPAGSTVRHLIAHASGLAYNEHKAVAAPGTRRLYSNAGFEVLANTVAEGSGIAFPDYLDEAVFQPLGMKSSRLAGSPAAGGVSTCRDLTAFAAELRSPNLIATATFKQATQVVFPGLSGVLPGLGHQRPNDWGLGFELRDHKSPHWTGANSSPRTFGHFGQSGTFLWVDPDARAACVALTDRDFGDWAKTAWPAFTDAVLAELAG
jgi:CubicO group peptidase (beta-lactamase class C family)